MVREPENSAKTKSACYLHSNSRTRHFCSATTDRVLVISFFEALLFLFFIVLPTLERFRDILDTMTDVLWQRQRCAKMARLLNGFNGSN